MAYFKDAQEVYEVIGKLFVDLADDPELGPRFRKANTILQHDYREPDSKITLRLQEDGPADVDFGETEMEPEVVMSMEADTAHLFWLGKVNVTTALARGQIKASGPVAKILKLVPLTKPVYPRYKAQLEAAGREDLVNAGVSAKGDAEEWAGIVSGLASERNLRYEPIGGINPKEGPVALCPGGTNRLTGELSDGFFGASCDADEHEEGGFGRKAILPAALLIKAHMPDLATVVPVFDVESVERTPGDMVDKHSRRRVEFESIDFNKRFIATVPKDHDPVALRELFSPGFIDWITRIPAEVDFGITEQQLFFHWRLRGRTKEELKDALQSAGGIFDRLHREMEENNLDIYKAGPWNAGLEPFPPKIGS